MRSVKSNQRKLKAVLSNISMIHFVSVTWEGVFNVILCTVLVS